MGGVGDVNDIDIGEVIFVVARQPGIAGENDEMAIRTEYRVVAGLRVRGVENDLAGRQIVKIDFRMRPLCVALIDDVMSIGAERSRAVAGAGCRACDGPERRGRQVIGEELAGPSGRRQVGTPECDDMAIGADGRLPERPGYPDRGRGDVCKFMTLLIIEADASALLDHKLAAVAA